MEGKKEAISRQHDISWQGRISLSSRDLSLGIVDLWKIVGQTGSQANEPAAR